MAKTIDEHTADVVKWFGTLNHVPKNSIDEQLASMAVRLFLLAVARDQQERDEKICAGKESTYNNGIAKECATAIHNQILEGE